MYRETARSLTLTLSQYSLRSSAPSQHPTSFHLHTRQDLEPYNYILTVTLGLFECVCASVDRTRIFLLSESSFYLTESTDNSHYCWNKYVVHFHLALKGAVCASHVVLVGNPCTRKANAQAHPWKPGDFVAHDHKVHTHCALLCARQNMLGHN